MSIRMLLFVCLISLSGCAGNEKIIPITESTNFDLAGEWHVSFSFFWASGGGSEHKEGTFIFSRSKGKYTGKYISEHKFEKDNLRKYTVTQDMAVEYTNEGTILLKGSNIQFSVKDEFSNWKPDNFKLFYTGDNNHLIMKYEDDHGNKGSGKITRKI